MSPSTIPIDPVVDKVIMTGEHRLPYRVAIGIYNEADSYDVTCLLSTQWLYAGRG